MGALAQVTPWIPEDDLLLKNAIEAGASLESLAKGAVQFSRRFTIRELQDRWHALLYDPVVSVEAAFRMTELERTNPSFTTKFARTGLTKESKSLSRKRKAEKLRTTYRSLRKKFCTEPFNSLDLDFLGATHLGFEDSHMDIIHNAFPDILGDDAGCVTNHHLAEGENGVSYDVGEGHGFDQHVGPSGCDAVHQGSDQKLDELKTTMALLENELFMEVDEKEADKSYYDGLTSLLVNPVSTEQEPSVAQTHEVDASLDDELMLEIDGALNAIECKPALDPHPEVIDGVICCLLNEEDPDIPCNDDVFLSNSNPMSVSALARRNFKDTNSPLTSSVREIPTSKEKSEGYSLLTQKKTPGRLQVSSKGKTEVGQPSQGVKLKALAIPESHNTVALGGSTASSNTLVPDGLKDGNKETDNGKLVFGFDGHGSCPGKDSGNSKEEKCVLSPINEVPHARDADNGLTEILDPEVEISQAEADGDVFESDEDLPNYSDIEAMILDMDLDPDDQDNFDLEVSKYQSQDMKRTIIRLEQAAYSYMQRAIASHGALAVLYGRYSKHYIKKPEVLVGRSTEDLAVDIDLGREKRGSKISRRQAIIRLGDDGSFHMKNLGKYAISVNEKEVDPGQTLILKSDCLVEIRGMPFIFETNQVRMKEYLKKTGKGN